MLLVNGCSHLPKMSTLHRWVLSPINRVDFIVMLKESERSASKSCLLERVSESCKGWSEVRSQGSWNSWSVVSWQGWCPPVLITCENVMGQLKKESPRTPCTNAAATLSLRSWTFFICLAWSPSRQLPAYSLVSREQCFWEPVHRPVLQRFVCSEGYN